MMNKENAELLIKELNNCGILVNIYSSPSATDYIRAKISIVQAKIVIDDYGILIKDKNDDEVEIRITYANLLNTKISKFDNTIITYKYKTVYQEIIF